MPFPTFATLEEIPEDQRDVYHEVDGKWHAKIPDVAGAVSTAAAEREKAKTEEKARKKAESDLVELRRTIDAKANGITDEQLQKIRDDEAKARQPIEQERDTLRQENRKLKLTDRVMKLALDAGVMPDRIDDAMDQLEKRTDLTDTGGIVVKAKDGSITAETIEAFLAKTFKVEKPWLYAGSGASGSGATGSTGSGGGGSDSGKPLSIEELAARKRASGKYAA